MKSHIQIENYKQQIEYEGKDQLYHRCGRIGNAQRCCPLILSKEINNKIQLKSCHDLKTVTFPKRKGAIMGNETTLEKGKDKDDTNNHLKLQSGMLSFPNNYADTSKRIPIKINTMPQLNNPEYFYTNNKFNFLANSRS